MKKMRSIGRLKSLGGFTEADKEDLVKIVKQAQWQGVSGTKGPWQQFLASIDKSSLQHDPAKRPWDVLASFVQTWKDGKDLQMAKQVREWMKHNRNMEMVETEESRPDTPEEELVRLTREHPGYKQNYTFYSYNEGWIRSESATRKELSTPTKLVGLDCEMVNCEDGTLEVVRVCVVDRDLSTLLDTLVRPSKKVSNYKTDITGVSREDLEGVTVTQSDIQKQVKTALTPGTIVVGHSVHNDLKALKIDHRRVIDTAFIFPVQNRPRKWNPSLRDLCKLVFGYDFRDNDKPHNCLVDAAMPMKLVLHCMLHGPISLTIPFEVDDEDLSKLLIHRVPTTLTDLELKDLFPKRFLVELQDVEKEDKSTSSKFCSKVAVFKSQEDANKAFGQMKGYIGEDTCGRLQKKVFLRPKMGSKNAARVEIMIRKMDIQKQYKKGELIAAGKTAVPSMSSENLGTSQLKRSRGKNVERNSPTPKKSKEESRGVKDGSKTDNMNETPAILESKNSTVVRVQNFQRTQKVSKKKPSKWKKGK